MSVDPLTLYKLMTLYMLNKVNFPLTNAQLSGFFQEKGYTTYIGFQQVLTELEETQLISYETIIIRLQKMELRQLIFLSIRFRWKS